MAEYNFDQNLDTEKFEVRIDTVAGRGYFEHNELGDECGGGLWFTDKELTDYDGVSVLPGEVEDALRNAGYTVE